jgi:hypothetical protein
MREVRFSELNPREAARWAAAIDEPKILAEPALRFDPLLSFVASLLIAAFALGVFAASDWPTVLPVHALVFALAGAAIVSLGRTALRAGAFERTRFLPGRYLYRWGYVEIDAEGLRFVSGDLLRHDVSIGPPRRFTGASRVVVRLSTDDGWSAAFRFIGSELDVPTEQLAALVPLTAGADVGYRDAALRPIEGRARARRLAHVLPALVGAVVAASVPIAAGWLEAERAVAHLADEYFFAERADEVERAYWYFPWLPVEVDAVHRSVVAAARAQMEPTLRTPYREAFVAEVGERRRAVDSSEGCVLRRDDLESLPTYDPARADGWRLAALPDLMPVATTPSMYLRVEHVAWGDTSERLRTELLSECRLVPVEPTGTTPAWASFDVKVGWSLVEDGVTTLQRTAQIRAQTIEAVTTCAGLEPDRADVRLHAAEMLVAATIFGDVFEAAAPDYMRRPYVRTWPGLASCAEREAASIAPAAEVIARGPS